MNIMAVPRKMSCCVRTTDLQGIMGREIMTPLEISAYTVIAILKCDKSKCTEYWNLPAKHI